MLAIIKFRATNISKGRCRTHVKLRNYLVMLIYLKTLQKFV